MRRTTILLASALFIAGSAGACGAEITRGAISVPLDEVRMVAFPRPISTLYVGNPVIADITMIDKRHAFVLGKAFGNTNIIALDGTGHQISNRQIVVFGSAGSTVTLQKGASRVTYACAGSRCETAPVPGDGADPYNTAMDQIQKHQELGSKTGGAQ